MAMNPDTNRMEPVFTKTVAREMDEPGGMLAALEATKGALYRPDGSTVPEHWSVFTVGEVVTINGYMFRVAYLGETSMLWEPVGPAAVPPEASGR